MAAPVGGLMWGGGAFALRVGGVFDRPSSIQLPPHISEAGLLDEEPQEPQEYVVPISVSP